MVKFAKFHANACQYADDLSTAKLMIGIVWYRFIIHM